MSSSLRRGTLAASTLALAVATLTACGAGNDAQTLEIKPDNAAAHVGDIKIQNVNVVTGTKGGDAATVTARVFNEGKKDQTLEAVTLKGTRAKLSPAKGEKKLVVPAGGSLMLGGKNNAAALLEDAKAAGVKDGNAQPVTFDLSSTGAVKLRATVVPATHAYESVGPTSKPSQSPSGSPDESASPGEGQSESPGANGGGENADRADNANNANNADKPGRGQEAQGAEGGAGASSDAGDASGAHAGH